MTAPVRVNNRGFTVLFEGPDPAVNIVFVHGFTGHPRDTWALKRKQKGRAAKSPRKHERDDTAAKPRSKLRRLLSGTEKAQLSLHSRSTTAESSIPERNEPSDNDGKDCQEDVYWPLDLAPQTAPNSRILTYGYDADVRHRVSGQVSQKTIYDYANDLLHSLEAQRRGDREKNRPILFIVHSLGGLITKVALRTARESASTKPHIHSIFEATAGVIFFGTPHRGADPRNFVHHALSASALVFGYRVNNQIEECGVVGLMGKKVVEKESSCLGDPTVETKLLIARDHMDMCRFQDVEDPEYRKVAAAITFILGKMTSDKAGATPEEVTSASGKTQNGGNALVSDKESDVSPQPEDVERNPPPTNNGEINAETKESLKAHLYFDKIDERLTSLAAAHGKTCRWFLSSPYYASWVDTGQTDVHGGFLWIKGNPGTGKSTLMKFLFEDAKERSSGSPIHITISFFFLARGTVEERSTTGLYRSLLHQLFTKAPDLDGALEWMTVNGARLIERNGWWEEALKLTLRHAVQRLGNRSLALFIDALDECDQQQAAGMVSFFEELCELAAERQVLLQICFSSRHYPSVVVCKGIELSLEDEEGQARDIQAYIKKKLRVGKSTAAQSLMSDIFNKSSRIFLWVVLVLDILNAENQSGAGSIKSMRRRLNEIPKGLEDLFEMILARDSDKLDQLRACLTWILFATRPLKPEELYFAVQFAVDDDCDGHWDREDVYLDQMKAFARSSSKGLAEVTRGRNPVVQFIHESVRDFLLGKYKRHWSGATDDFVAQGHKLLRDCCRAHLLVTFWRPADVNAVIEFLPKMKSRLHEHPELRYLDWYIERLDFRHIVEEIEKLLPLFGSTSANETIREIYGSLPVPVDNVKTAAINAYPFLGYAVANVLLHANSSQHGGADQKDFLVNFPLRRRITIANLMEVHLVRRYTPSATLPYLLAERNLADLIRALGNRDACLEVGKERYGPPLFAAVTTGSADAAEALINMESDGKSLFRSPREKFCFKGSDIFTRPDRTFTYKDSMGIMSQAAKWGDVPLLKALLSWGLHPNGPPGRKSLPICIAAREGNAGAVKLLLDVGKVHADVGDSNGRTPLSHASAKGHASLIGLLLETDLVDVNRIDNYGRSPLSYAAQFGNESVLKRLLDAGGIGGYGRDDSGRTPLSYATERGHEVIVQCLLEAGATDISEPDKFGDTPLHFAARNGSKSVMRHLVEAGAVNIDAQNQHGQTALLLSANLAAENSVKLLLDTGAAGITKRDSLGRTALTQAVINGAEGVVSLLLDAGAVDIDVPDKTGPTALNYAVSRRHKAVEDLLRE